LGVSVDRRKAREVRRLALVSAGWLSTLSSPHRRIAASGAVDHSEAGPLWAKVAAMPDVRYTAFGFQGNERRWDGT
jgi:hypothetical protein